jgi:hypothetical protein
LFLETRKRRTRRATQQKTGTTSANGGLERPRAPLVSIPSQHAPDRAEPSARRERYLPATLLPRVENPYAAKKQVSDGFPHEAPGIGSALKGCNPAGRLRLPHDDLAVR